MKGMMKKKDSRNLLSVVMVAILIGSVLMAFIPPVAASVTITNFVITPADNTAGVTSAYTIQVNTTNFTSLTATIPKGFKAKTPSAGNLIATVDLWWDNPSPYYGCITFRANTSSPATRMDVRADIGGGYSESYRECKLC